MKSLMKSANEIALKEIRVPLESSIEARVKRNPDHFFRFIYKLYVLRVINVINVISIC